MRASICVHYSTKTAAAAKRMVRSRVASRVNITKGMTPLRSSMASPNRRRGGCGDGGRDASISRAQRCPHFPSFRSSLPAGRRQQEAGQHHKLLKWLFQLPHQFQAKVSSPRLLSLMGLEQHRSCQPDRRRGWRVGGAGAILILRAGRAAFAHVLRRRCFDNLTYPTHKE